ncbi:MAG TPA: hypothetical protein VFN03_02540, partial [Trueperaceae bacterium]|nr:hypothetical protein [Trueperaceae bacterium]
MSELLLTVILVVCVTALVLGYFYLVQRKHYDVTIAALGRVDEIRVRETATFALPASSSDSSAEGVTKAKTPLPLTIEGTKTVSVGRQSAPFTIVDALPAGVSVTWRVEPGSSAGLAPAVASVTLFPAVIGTMVLHASVTDAAGKVTHQGSFTTTAVEAPRASTLELPWVGQGAGTLVVTVMILGIVLYLATEQIIDAAV